MSDPRKSKSFIDKKLENALRTKTMFVFGCNTEAEAVYLRDTWLDRIENIRPELTYHCNDTKITFPNGSEIEFVYPTVVTRGENNELSIM